MQFIHGTDELIIFQIHSVCQKKRIVIQTLIFKIINHASTTIFDNDDDQ